MVHKPQFILLVEDDVFLRQTLAEALSDEGFEVASTVDGQDALDWLSSAPAMPQVIMRYNPKLCMAGI